MDRHGEYLALLGAPALIEGDSSRPLQISEKTLALLALLVCNAERPLSRAWLAGVLWPDVEEAEARTNLRRHFYKLTKALPVRYADAVLLKKNNAQWNRAACRVDVVEFAAAVEAQEYERAVSFYGGPLCAGAFEENILELRERLEQRYAEMLRRIWPPQIRRQTRRSASTFSSVSSRSIL